MPLSEKFYQSFVAGQTYHVIFKANSGRNLFLSDENKRYFQKKIRLYLSPFVLIRSFNLLDNHVHLIIEIHSEKRLRKTLSQIPSENLVKTMKDFLNGFATVHELITRQISRLLIGYAIALNNQQGTVGHLFHRKFRRILIDNEVYLSQVILYVHANPVHHRLTKRIEKYRWSSFYQLIRGAPDLSDNDWLIQWFGGMAALLNSHQKYLNQIIRYPQNRFGFQGE